MNFNRSSSNLEALTVKTFSNEITLVKMWKNKKLIKKGKYW